MPSNAWIGAGRTSHRKTVTHYLLLHRHDSSGGASLAPASEVRAPVVHQRSPPLEQVRPRIGRLDLVLDHVSQRCLDHLPRVAVSSATQSRNDDRKPCATAGIRWYLSILGSVDGAIGLLLRIGNTSGLSPSPSARAALRISTARRLSGCPSSLSVREWTPGPDRPRAHAGERGQRAREGAEDELLGDQPSDASDQADSGCLSPLVSTVQSTDSRQCDDFRCRRRSVRDRSQAPCVLVQPQVATVLMIVADVSSHEPDALRVLSLPVNICFVLPWLHPLKSWSLREVQGGSYEPVATPYTRIDSSLELRA